MEVVVYQGSDEWSALYVGGTLDMVGSHYLIDERIRSLFDIETISSNDFMRGGNQRKDVARTLDELRMYTQQREHNERAAAEMLAQAQELIDQAKELDPSITI